MSTDPVAPLRGITALLAVVVLLSSTPVHAMGGLMYRAASTGRWTDVAMSGEPLPPGSIYAGGKFDSFGKPALASTTQCGGASLVAFCANVWLPVAQALFLYDATSGTLHDVVTVSSCSSGHEPVIAIDSSACQAHVIYPDNRTILDATFSLPTLTGGGVTTLVENLVTPAPSPFPTGALLALSGRMTVSTAYAPGPGVVVAFFAQVKGPGSVGSEGIFSWATGGTITVHARKMDPSCPPPWPEAGDVYTTFGPAPVAAALSGPAAIFLAHSNGPESKDTAIVLNESGCGGTNVVQAAEHSATPLGGRYDNFGMKAELAGAANGMTAFRANVLGVDGTRQVLMRSTGDVVARRGFADTALGSSPINFGSPLSPSINSGGAVVFTAGVLSTGSMLLYDTPAILPELVTPGAKSPQIDELGNIVTLR